ncbi:hypothetical protein HOA92_07005 [archaeon]|jgi:vacuolar-type H+-ATPase subunit F/Vma7|nr:hypothetical protein [archaeon]MBT6762761.1 hypothetical protein [archaeon]
MIGVIGFQDEIIGLGLSGVSRLVEVESSITKPELLKILSQLKGLQTIFMSERLLEMINQEKSDYDIFFIEIPENFSTKGLEKIDQLARETLGISLH